MTDAPLHRRIIGYASIFALAIALGGCAALSQSDKPTPEQRSSKLEPMLAAAGFAMLPADTPQRQEQLSTLPPLTVSYYVGRKGKLHYWMADPQYCKCLYLGTEENYQKYEQMRLQQNWQQKENRDARENLEASQEEQMELQTEMFNPYGGMGWIGPGMYY
ncbi:MAG: hypothetical protein WBE78_04485 [Candidatus Binataceae bacterium]|jgi:hypothetical protein